MAAMVAQFAKPIEIEIDPESDAGKRLATAGDGPVVLVSGSRRFREVTGSVSEDQTTLGDPTSSKDPFANYDPDRAMAAWQGTFGLLKGLDIEAFKAEMREARGQDSKGRPG